MKIKCWWIFGHNYTKWTDVTWGKDKKTITHDVNARAVIYQTRDCKDCGRTEIRSSAV